MAQSAEALGPVLLAEQGQEETQHRGKSRPWRLCRGWFQEQACQEPPSLRLEKLLRDS